MSKVNVADLKERGNAKTEFIAIADSDNQDNDRIAISVNGVVEKEVPVLFFSEEQMEKLSAIIEADARAIEVESKKSNENILKRLFKI